MLYAYHHKRSRRGGIISYFRTSEGERMSSEWKHPTFIVCIPFDKFRDDDCVKNLFRIMFPDQKMMFSSSLDGAVHVCGYSVDEDWAVKIAERFPDYKSMVDGYTCSISEILRSTSIPLFYEKSPDSSLRPTSLRPEPVFMFSDDVFYRPMDISIGTITSSSALKEILDAYDIYVGHYVEKNIRQLCERFECKVPDGVVFLEISSYAMNHRARDMKKLLRLNSSNAVEMTPFIRKWWKAVLTFHEATHSPLNMTPTAIDLLRSVGISPRSHLLGNNKPWFSGIISDDGAHRDVYSFYASDLLLDLMLKSKDPLTQKIACLCSELDGMYPEVLISIYRKKAIQCALFPDTSDIIINVSGDHVISMDRIAVESCTALSAVFLFGGSRILCYKDVDGLLIQEYQGVSPFCNHAFAAVTQAFKMVLAMIVENNSVSSRAISGAVDLSLVSCTMNVNGKEMWLDSLGDLTTDKSKFSPASSKKYIEDILDTFCEVIGIQTFK